MVQPTNTPACTLTDLPKVYLKQSLEYLTADELATARTCSHRLNERVQTLCASRLADASQRPNSSLVGRIARKAENQNAPANVRYSKLIYRINKLMHYLLLPLPDGQWNPSENFDHIEDTFNSLPLDDLPRSLILAASNGDITALQELLSLDRDHPIPDQNRLPNHNLGDVLRAAAKSDHAEVVRAVFEDSHISHYDVDSALRIAVINGHAEVVQAILADHHIPGPNRLSNRNLGDALLNAATRGHVEVVREILRDDRISNRHVGIVLRVASERGRVEAVRELLGDNRTSFAKICSALLSALVNGRLAVARELFSNMAHRVAHAFSRYFS